MFKWLSAASVRRKLLSLVTVAAVVLITVTPGLAAGKPPIIVFMPPGTDNYLAQWQVGAHTKAKELGYDIRIIESSRDQAEQDSQVQQQLASGEDISGYIWWPYVNAAGTGSLRLVRQGSYRCGEHSLPRRRRASAIASRDGRPGRRVDPAGVGIDPDVQFAPRQAPARTVLLYQPFAGARQLQPSAVHQQMHGLGAGLRSRHRQRLGSPAQVEWYRDSEIEAEQADDGADQPFGLPQSQAEHGAQR
jgi:hypothetical protein